MRNSLFRWRHFFTSLGCWWVVLKGILSCFWSESFLRWSWVFFPWVTLLPQHLRCRPTWGMSVFNPFLEGFTDPTSSPAHHDTCTRVGLSSYAPEGSLLHAACTKVSPIESKGRPSDPLYSSYLTPQVSAHPILCFYPLLSLQWGLCPGTGWVPSSFLNEWKIKQYLWNVFTFLPGYMNYHPSHTFNYL